MMPDPGAPPQLGIMRPTQVPYVAICNTSFAEGPGPAAGAPMCDCGTYAIGICVECHKPVCGQSHCSRTGSDGRRRCTLHASEREAAAERARREANAAQNEELGRRRKAELGAEAARRAEHVAIMDRRASKWGGQAGLQTHVTTLRSTLKEEAEPWFLGAARWLAWAALLPFAWVIVGYLVVGIMLLFDVDGTNTAQLISAAIAISLVLWFASRPARVRRHNAPIREEIRRCELFTRCTDQHCPHCKQN